jgi:hypothetical protein
LKNNHAIGSEFKKKKAEEGQAIRSKKTVKKNEKWAGF